EMVGLGVLVLAAPLLQPQFFALAWVRHAVGRGHGAVLAAMAAPAGAAAWVVAEAWGPKLLGDTLGYGLYPSRELRQAADLVGSAGLTLLLLLANEWGAQALARRRVTAGGWRAAARPLALAAAVPLMLGGYGAIRLATLPAPAGPTLRVGLVQSNIVDYERLRRERGSGAVVREVLDTHYAMTHDAVVRQRVQAVLWSETVYPTTFGQPRSEAGAELDREIVAIVNAAGVPFVFGTYDRDGAGEYNAAAFVAPGVGLVGFYRKTRPFPFTEHVPAWLDRPWLRRWLPWTGHWLAGQGARVLPLKLADGREVPVLPLICLDAVDTELAIDGARLGATAILTMSNDSWFTERPLGAQLHQVAAAFRSIETRLPQFRVTTNGMSGVIDATGAVHAGSSMGEQTLVVGELPVPTPPRTLMVAWGDWVPRLCGVFLAALGLWALWTWRSTRWRPHARNAHRRPPGVAEVPPPGTAPAGSAVLPPVVTLLAPSARLAAALLRGVSGISLLGMAIALLAGDEGPLTGTLAPLRMFAALCLAPEAAAWLVLRASRASLALENNRLVFRRGGRRVELGVHEIVALEPWRLRLPLSGLSLRLTGRKRWSYGLAGVDAPTLMRALQAAGGTPVLTGPAWALADAHARAAVRRGWFHRPWTKFLLLPFVLAVPAFRLHQHIAYGSTFGEWQTFGPVAFVAAFGLWWAQWIVGVVLVAAVLRTALELGVLAVAWLQPAAAIAARQGLERIGLVVLYAGLPTWLLLRMAVG
ncbi:MAG: apolipoprotein N-acyltransferase, partial [Rubrivivax sp.]